MNNRRLSLVIVSLLVVPTALVTAASPAAAAKPTATFGSHVSACAQMENGFDGQHNPSHHRGPSGTHMGDMAC